ncbi:RNA methyltransferase [Natronomonas gomsonensis]|jgi:predicted SPOUT superfamily RNA methylase MTH1|uniref:RNA methyltransferase n=1 Tax=Natronomonas gomsonensis TaxID=1046043 RepID=UPI0020CA8DA8|nr:RNA methyltransferase [Natronomonas gomsonensis]MCY4731212.1 RNA methyltransferase [Natronomonas gomsonensis]
MTRSVLVPSSLTREAEDKREATRKLGYVARAAVIFRVDRLIVYPDRGGDDGRFGDGFVDTVLSYAATAPYLRKEVWAQRDELEYAGILPPLRIRSQTGSGSDGSGSLRQGIVTEVGSDGRVRVNCGLQHPISLPVPPSMAVEEGERVTIRVSSRRPVRAKLVDEPLPGFSVERATIDDALTRPDAGVRIAASRYGEELTVDRLDQLVERTATDGLTVTFGAPERGLPEILDCQPGEEVISDDEPKARFDLWLNTVPNQGSEVVRTEEAVFATLAPLTLE